ncbi:hypothetical protein [Clostridium sp. CF012]|uniref:hypothetical protein n=1 Tax=Clostridium sp. CF012 TaxID=2843319 RepID=UPI001C0C73F6|nr:hypothetical protein [Clostridium sp. CF012]MBU3142850.1 hypothetical protein [Clostridium sp. CF012]
MKFKKNVAGILSLVLIFTLVGCSPKPSEKKIKAALENGTITVADAKSKGWINDEWIEKNYKPIPSLSKIHLFTPFQTTYLDGTPAPKNVIAGKMHVAFFNSKSDKATEQIKILNSVYDKFVKYDIPILGVVLDEDLDGAKERLKGVKFPVIVYNEEMKKSLKGYADILKTDYSSVWTKDGGFYTAWSYKDDTDSLNSYAEGLSNEK